MCIRQTLLYAFCLFFLSSGFAHAVLLAVDDSYGIPVSRILTVESFGVLDNDTLDGLNAGENGVTASLHSDVSKGTLSCPGVGPGLCDDGSFEYTPGPGFDGFDSFQYQAVSVSTSETSSPITVTLSACSGGPTVYICWHEASYLAKLSELGYSNAFQESFEGTAWDVARSPVTAPSVQSKGITWTTNHPVTNEITTGSGPARTGAWGVFDPDHGVATGTTAECDIDNPPVHCLPYDGFSGSIPGPDVLYGVGGYISGFTGANVDIILDGTAHNAGKVIVAGHHFMGVIDTAGFNAFEFREVDGKVGQFLYIFGDDFTIATSAAFPGSIQFSAPTYSVAEDGIMATINVTRTGGSSGAASVNYATSNGSATAGSDYTATSGSINFADGDAVTKSFTVAITNDGIYEGDENVNLNLSNASGASLGTPASATLTITDDDPVPPSGSIQFSAPTYSVAENGTSATITVTRSGGSYGAASVYYATSDGSATLADSDYSSSSGTINFGDGDAVARTFTVNINDDSAYEGDETVNLSLTGATGASLGAQSSAVLTITEDDPIPLPSGSLQFSAPTYNVAENGTSATITVTRTGGSAGTVGVDYASSDGSAKAGSDYTAVNGTLSLADGVLSDTFTVLITDDSIYEGDEALDLTLSNPSGGASLGAQSSAVLTITEDDPAPAGTLQFSAPTYTVAENGTSVTIDVTRTGGSYGAVSVNYATSNGTATAGSDYAAASGTLSFDDGDATTKSFIVAITNDINYEGDETVNLSLSNVSGASLGTSSSAVLTIIEDDPVPPSGSVHFNAANYSVAEDGIMATITVARTGGSYGAASVSYATSDGTATAGSDYTATSGTINFADGDSASKIFTVAVANNAGAYEGDETVNLSLSGITGASLGSPALAVLTISENDPIPPSGSIQFSAPTYTVAENGTSVTINVTRTGGSYGAASVNYSTSNGTATAGSDYTSTSGTLNFADGDTASKSFSITVLNDSNYEGEETVNLTLSGASGANLGAQSSAVLTITEDDPAPVGTLQFSAPSYNVAENGTSVTVTVTRSGGSAGTVGVDYASSDGTASAGSDYTSVAGTLSLADGVMSDTFTVLITDDSTYEGDETVNLSLSNPSGGASLGAQSSAVLNIIEDDAAPVGTLQFSAPTYTVAENGASVTVTVTRTGGSAGTVGVDYASSDGTATDPGDYTAVSGTLSFADGVTSQTFTVGIIDNAVYEGNKTVNLSLSFPSGGASLGVQDTAILTITEDEQTPPTGSLQFSAPTYTVAENGTTATITVSRIGGSFGTVGVDYASNDGTAADGSDYTGVNGSLSFADGVTSQSFSVSITNDSTYEGDETVNLTLSSPTGGAGLGSPASAVLTITEDDPVPPAGSLQFSAPTYAVTENGTTATITVTRVGGSFGTVGVSYASSDSSATAGSDYTAVNGSLSFAGGVTSQSFSVSITDDSTYEGDETVNLTLSNPTGGAGLGSPVSAVLTITEDDPVPPAGSLQFSAPSYSVVENGTSVAITVTRTGGSFGTVGVSYASSDSSASAGSDYTAVNGSLSFADGVISQSFSITILDDADYEGDENLILTLSSPTGGAGLGSPATAALTIVEDEVVPLQGSLQFSASTYSVTEDGVVAVITVERVGGSSGAVSVDYATSDGTATAGDDYIAISGTLSFADGVTSRTFSIQIIDDTVVGESNESLNLILSNPTGGAGLGSPFAASLTITEQDRVVSDSGGSSIDLVTLMLFFILYLRGFRKKLIR